MPPLQRREAAELVAKRHPSWVEHQVGWRRRGDLLEGGARFKYARYDVDPIGGGGSLGRYGAIDSRTSKSRIGAADDAAQSCEGPFYSNLIAHHKEKEPGGYALYRIRHARTPCPNEFQRVVHDHTGEVYSRDVVREGDPEIERWWEDVDGKGTSIDRWMVESFAPLFLAVGFLDVQFDRPEIDPGEAPRNRYEEAASGLDRCVASIILPENVVWWRTRPDGKYAECLVFVRSEDEKEEDVFHHWTESEVNVYKYSGEHVPSLSRAHNYGVVPIVRAFDRRLVRCPNVGVCRYDGILDRDLALYNADADRVSSDVVQTGATLTGPREALESDDVVRTRREMEREFSSHGASAG